MMKFQKMLAAVAAGSVLLGVCSLGASADEVTTEGAMTFRTTVSKQYVKVSELANSDMTLQGNVFVDNYTGLASFKLSLGSDEPLTICNGGYTMPSFFEGQANSSSIYAQENEDGTPTNVALYYNDSQGILPWPNSTIANPGGALLSFDVIVPQGTPAGVYKLGCQSGFKTNSIGLKEYYCFAKTAGGGDTDYAIQNAEIIVEPNALLGDVNCDGSVDAIDATKVLQYFAGGMMGYDEDKRNEYFGTPYIHTALEAAQTQADGVIDERDAVKILRYFAYHIVGTDVEWEDL